MKAISSRDFNRDVSQAKRAARSEPVFVTDRGSPTHVLLSIEAYQRLSGGGGSIVDVLAMPGVTEPLSGVVAARRGGWPGVTER